MKQVLTQQDKDTILRLKSEQSTWITIGKAVNAKPETCKKFFQRHQKTAGLPPKDIMPKGMIQGRLARVIKAEVRDNPSISYRNLAARLEEKYGPEIRTPGKTTCHKFLKEQSFKIVKLWKKPIISAVNKSKRINFAQKCLEKPSEFWKDVIWSDETMVRSNPKSGDVFVKVHSSVNRENLPVNGKSQNQGVSAMFWGFFSARGLGNLIAIEGTMNSEKYIEVLREYLLPEIDECDVQPVFMQDNAPCHKSRAVMDFFAEKSITTLDWPPQSPDMNPIENLWSIIKRRRAAKFHLPRTKSELIDQVFAIWTEIDENLRNNLVNSMKNRFLEVLRLRGNPTKY